MVRTRLAAGADATISESESTARTTLFWALNSRRTRPEVIRMLLEAGADVNGRNAAEDTPLTYAARYRLTAVTRLLIDHGADKDAVGNFGLTARQWAMLTLNPHLARML